MTRTAHRGIPSTTLSRLREIKREVDPDNVFDQNFPVA
ncbi:BBE domain-containing protein [Streptomyces sp. KM273126]|nr:BBE domain-containing protein [Streptomyces sp. KM273126]